MFDYSKGPLKMYFPLKDSNSQIVYVDPFSVTAVELQYNSSVSTTYSKVHLQGTYISNIVGSPKEIIDKLVEAMKKLYNT